MSFLDLNFILSFAAFFALYWLFSHKLQNVFLLGASYLFYSYIDVKFAILLLAQTAVNYYSCMLMGKFPSDKKKYFIGAVAINIIILGFFKYYNFFIENVNFVLKSVSLNTSLPIMNIILPLGVSFYTFQNISYVADVYKEKFTHRNNFITYALFISFFPKLISGPIERASDFLTQIEKERHINLNDILSGVALFLWGGFQKLVIANNIAFISDKIFLLKKPDLYMLCAGVFVYTIQILADFSGYTDMARGLGKLLGFNLARNFDNPYLAKSPSDFWKRWHISFSSWIRDYIYIPLGGSRVSQARWVTNIFIVFFFTGLWHGASWNYIVWGLYYWVLYLIYRLWEKISPPAIYNFKYSFVVSIPIMFLLTNLGWLIFKETDLTYLIKHFTETIFLKNPTNLQPAVYLTTLATLYSAPLILSSLAFYYLKDIKKANADSLLNSAYLKAIAAIVLFFGILFYKNTSGVDFIYFNF